jgi:hypothetical protein
MYNYFIRRDLWIRNKKRRRLEKLELFIDILEDLELNS